MIAGIVLVVAGYWRQWRAVRKCGRFSNSEGRPTVRVSQRWLRHERTSDRERERKREREKVVAVVDAVGRQV